MGNVKSIEKAVESLAPVELTEFRRWFAEFDATALKPQSIYSDPNGTDLSDKHVI